MTLSSNWKMNACDIKSTWRWALTFDPWGLQCYSNHKSPQVGLHVCAPLGTGVIHTLDREPRPCGSFYWHVCPFTPSGIRYTYQYHSQNGLHLVFPSKNVKQFMFPLCYLRKTTLLLSKSWFDLKLMSRQLVMCTLSFPCSMDSLKAVLGCSPQILLFLSI